MPNLLGGRTRFEFDPAVGRVPNANLSDNGGTSFRLSARILSSAAGADGVLVSYGDRAAGIVWYVKDGLVTAEMHARGGRDTLVAKVPIGAGTHDLVFDFVQCTTSGGGFVVDCRVGFGKRIGQYEHSDVLQQPKEKCIFAMFAAYALGY